MQKQQESFNEHLDSLTGYEELEIQAQFGDDILSLLNLNYTMASRALIYVTRRRDGLDEAKAKDAAMKLSLKEVGASFAAEEDEPMPEEPVTAQGKGSEGGE